MRAAIVCLAALALTACTPAKPRPASDHVPSLEVRNPSHIPIYEGSAPRCPFREVGSVAGQTRREIQGAAFRLRANAVILEPVNQLRPGGVMQRVAVQFTSAACQR
jgi:hypothetical protein